MLYELIAVVRTGNVNFVKEIARAAGTTILSQSPSPGVIRNLSNWGVFDLPKPTTKHQTQHFKGHYFCLTFDSSSATQQQLQRQLKLNPNMIKYAVVKLGDKLGGYNNQRGKIEGQTGELVWNRSKTNVDIGLVNTKTIEGDIFDASQSGSLRDTYSRGTRI